MGLSVFNECSFFAMFSHVHLVALTGIYLLSFALLLYLALLGLHAWRKVKEIEAAKRDILATRERITKYWHERQSMLATGLEGLANSQCPLCAAAADVMTINNENGPMIVEAEEDGTHPVRQTVDGQEMQMRGECKAAQLRASARKLFEESMQEIENENRS